MQLHDVHQGIHKNKKRKRIGRGTGSGHGKTAGKGHKGHSSRQGFKYGLLFEGGQITLARRIPKRGFSNGRFKKDYAIVNLDALDVFDAGTVVDEELLRARGIVKGRHDDGVKVLGDGEVKKALTVRVAKFSESAARKLADAGGKAEVV